MEKKAIFIDFDNTITRVHISGEVNKLLSLNNLKEAKKKVLSNWDINNFSPLFKESLSILLNFPRLYNEGSGYILFVIVSYGYKDIIEEYLKRLNVDVFDLFDEILTPNDFKGPDGNQGLDGHDNFKLLDGKNRMIEYIQEKYSINNENCLLLDDSEKNIDAAYQKRYLNSRNAAAKQLQGNYLTHIVNKHTGLTIEDWNCVLKKLNLD